eukprot:CAMPEP_0194121644 /NCGR_PEP_ID=MMETSP0150-20130528/47800_1 /TAXON_ID=122233 /ORGANISM="Chaetoceros debilis, Strain MM31A-1" /LENGTH=102 /DNA_ID=CAMNT_0038814171 /DNA_START=403 /DNA_END=708 /DNA_ORIENTATION=+
MIQLMNNTGIGFRMTSSRIYQGPQSEGPSPQCYDTCAKLTPREKKQNDLIAQRYENWKYSTKSCTSKKKCSTRRDEIKGKHQISSHYYSKNEGSCWMDKTED